MGAHDLGKSSEDICIRLARPDDTFLAFGGEKDETLMCHKVTQKITDSRHNSVMIDA